MNEKRRLTALECLEEEVYLPSQKKNKKINWTSGGIFITIGIFRNYILLLAIII